MFHTELCGAQSAGADRSPLVNGRESGSRMRIVNIIGCYDALVQDTNGIYSHRGTLLNVETCTQEENLTWANAGYERLRSTKNTVKTPLRHVGTPTPVACTSFTSLRIVSE